MYAPVGKSGPRHQLHHFFQRRVGLFDQQDRGVDDFAQIVRRNVRRHADGDAARAVDQQIRDARRQHHRLFARLIEVRNEIDGFFFEVGENVFVIFASRASVYRIAAGGSPSTEPKFPWPSISGSAC